MTRHAWRIGRLVILGVVCPAEAAVVTEFTTYESWVTQAGTVTPVLFTELPPDTLVTDQYQSIGAMFTDADGNWTLGVGSPLFPQDGTGLDGEYLITVELLTPAVGVAAHFPGGVRYRLYSGESLVYQSSYFGGGGIGNFGGVISATAFDRIEIIDLPNNQVFLDNLYLSFAPVPAPSGLALLALGTSARCRRRRS